MGKQVKTRFLEIMKIDLSLDRCRMLAKIKVAKETSREGWKTLHHLGNVRWFGRDKTRSGRDRRED